MEIQHASLLSNSLFSNQLQNIIFILSAQCVCFKQRILTLYAYPYNLFESKPKSVLPFCIILKISSHITFYNRLLQCELSRYVLVAIALPIVINTRFSAFLLHSVIFFIFLLVHRYGGVNECGLKMASSNPSFRRIQQDLFIFCHTHDREVIFL